MMESDRLSPHPYHAPAVENDDEDGNGIEHRFRADPPSVLNTHKDKHTHTLAHKRDQ